MTREVRRRCVWGEIGVILICEQKQVVLLWFDWKALLLRTLSNRALVFK